MKLDFLKKEPDSTRLVLVFAGWSAGPEIARAIDLPGWDVAVAHDFTELSLDCGFMDEYYTIYLFAWSLGVYAASRVLSPERITAAFALNGTLTPVDDYRGIPRAIFKGTADNLNPRNLQKFRMRMMSNREQKDAAIAFFPEVNDETRINNLQRQLYTILNSSQEQQQSAGLNWIRAYISRNDRIFPPDNMLRAWKETGDVEIVELDSGHFVEFEKIVGNIIPDRLKVARRFTKAADTYDAQAIAQCSIAVKLASKLSETGLKGGRFLEIGCGTGLLTREYRRHCDPDEVTFVDIAEIRPFGIFKNEKYIKGDAENWIEQQSEKWDAIVSSSCIQWFSNVERFFRNCEARLNDGGILAISTFLPGNLKELDKMRPSPLIYPDESELRGYLEPLFAEVKIENEDIEVEFQSYRDMLMHLKHTGVGGSSSTAGLSNGTMRDIKRITYRPVYIVCRK